MLKDCWKERSEPGKKWRSTEMKGKRENRECKAEGKKYEEKEDEGKIRK